MHVTKETLTVLIVSQRGRANTRVFTKTSEAVEMQVFKWGLIESGKDRP